MYKTTASKDVAKCRMFGQTPSHRNFETFLLYITVDLCAENEHNNIGIVSSLQRTSWNQKINNARYSALHRAHMHDIAADARHAQAFLSLAADSTGSSVYGCNCSFPTSIHEFIALSPQHRFFVGRMHAWCVVSLPLLKILFFGVVDTK